MQVNWYTVNIIAISENLQKPTYGILNIFFKSHIKIQLTTYDSLDHRLEHFNVSSLV